MTHRESRCILTRPISHGAFPLGPSVAVGVSFPPNVSRADSTECWYVAWALSSPRDSGLLFPLKQTWTAWVRQPSQSGPAHPRCSGLSLNGARGRLQGQDFVGHDIIPRSGMSKKTHFLLLSLKLKRNLNGVVEVVVCIKKVRSLYLPIC